MSEILPSSVNKCCFNYDLIIGCAIFVTVEVYVFALLSIFTTYNEFKLIINYDSVKFRNFTNNSTYYAILFGAPTNDLGQGIIGLQIALNGLIMVCCICYFISAIVLLIGISERNLSYFRPYLLIDTCCLYIAVAGIVISVLLQHHVLFRNCVIFALKFYPATCVYSLFKKLGGHPILRNYKSLTFYDTPPHANPAIRLARCETESHESSNQISDDSKLSIKVRGSFSGDNHMNEQAPAHQDPVINKNNEQVNSNLKPGSPYKRNLLLQLPINLSYP